MLDSNLPSPGFVPTGQRLRGECAKAISYAEVMADMRGGKSEQAKSLDTFFAACRTALSTLIDAAAPTLVSGLITRSTAPKTVVLTISEVLDGTITPAPTDFVVRDDTVANVVTAVAISENTITLTLTSDMTAGVCDVAYTQPVTNGARDLTGNLLASFAATAITNNA